MKKKIVNDQLLNEMLIRPFITEPIVLPIFSNRARRCNFRIKTFRIR